ncbi:beta-propeller domain-containing protein [Halalkalibacter urbisdiaboli]|uniref:beta-propeller domain-containing protein n=1 Tax=Halalkalibacter urbisdiaboli TaxID=1960589 RepID=UPI000B44F63D|nr:beta-propeller domain-containing protein [Halalkalibacter urbisdiaboli]
MNKRVIWLTGGGILTIVLMAIIFFRLTPTVNVAGTEVLGGHSFPVQLSTALDPETVSTKTVYVKDFEGERFPAEVKLSADRKTLHVTVEKGEWDSEEKKYTLHLSNEIRSAYGLPLRGEQSFAFTVREELPRFASEEEILAYIEEGESNTKVRLENATATEESSGSTFANDTSGDYSSTNNQVEGVEEGDIVQTDGEYIYQVTNEGIVITNIQELSDMSVASIIRFENTFHATNLFLTDDTLIVIGDKWEQYRSSSTKEISTMPAMEGMTLTRVYDISDRTNPELKGESGTEGHLVSSRMIEDHLYYVTSYYPMVRTMEEGKEEVSVRPVVYNGEDYTKVALDNIARIPNSEERSFTVITAINTKQPSSAVTVDAFIGAGGQMYMSQEHIYLASNSYNGEDSTTSTDIFKFALDGLNVPFIASGSVVGTVLNQFSMDEYDGNFRIATTEGQTWGDHRNSKSHVFILDEKLNEIGHVGDLAPEERIYSARFMGDMIYLVTFREMDPLFVIDATNPTNPEVLGELKIPGVSTYLHPIDENHLIGFGVETKLGKPREQGSEPIVRQDGMKISIFDVSDFYNPKEKFVEVIGGEGTYSELMHNHKALTIHPEKPVYAFPIHLYNSNKPSDDREWTFDGQGAMVYNITPEGIERLASLISEGEGQRYESYEQSVQRSVYANGYLFILSPGGLTAFDEETYEKVGNVLYREKAQNEE